jgi:hypothetical protein
MPDRRGDQKLDIRKRVGSEEQLQGEWRVETRWWMQFEAEGDVLTRHG